MKCKVDGCYAKPFNRNLCRAHFYAWNDQLPATAPGSIERGPFEQPRRQPRPTNHGMPTYAGPCRCDEPRPHKIPLWGCFECLNCGMPLPTERITA